MAVISLYLEMLPFEIVACSAPVGWNSLPRWHWGSYSVTTFFKPFNNIFLLTQQLRGWICMYAIPISITHSTTWSKFKYSILYCYEHDMTLNTWVWLSIYLCGGQNVPYVRVLCVGHGTVTWLWVCDIA